MNDKNIPRMIVVFLAIIWLFVGLFAGYCISSAVYGDRLEMAERVKRDAQELYSNTIHWNNYINPKSYRDNVSLFEDEEYYYIVHSVNFTYMGVTAGSFRIPKGAMGELYVDEIEVWRDN